MLKSLEWTKPERRTGKVELSNQFLEEEKLTFQKNISSFVVEHSIPKELIINLDQTSLSYVTPGKYIFDLKGVKTIPVNGTVPFSISISG